MNEGIEKFEILNNIKINEAERFYIEAFVETLVSIFRVISSPTIDKQNPKILQHYNLSAYANTLASAINHNSSPRNKPKEIDTLLSCLSDNKTIAELLPFFNGQLNLTTRSYLYGLGFLAAIQNGDFVNKIGLKGSIIEFGRHGAVKAFIYIYQNNLFLIIGMY